MFIARNTLKAEKIFSKNCYNNNNNDTACFMLGTLYESGDNEVKKNTKEAVKLFEAACNNGHGPACNR